MTAPLHLTNNSSI
uniref:Uncharacterized protein n=1 Tax=Rhizophora mucronata TaxID=61149 RepID=A0A2P2NR22_RHIMU